MEARMIMNGNPDDHRLKNYNRTKKPQQSLLFELLLSISNALFAEKFAGRTRIRFGIEIWHSCDSHYLKFDSIPWPKINFNAIALCALCGLVKFALCGLVIKSLGSESLRPGFESD